MGWTITAILVTIVEQARSPRNRQGLQQVSPTAFGMMFVAVFLGNTMFAIDGFREAKAISASAV